MPKVLAVEWNAILASTKERKTEMWEVGTKTRWKHGGRQCAPAAATTLRSMPHLGWQVRISPPFGDATAEECEIVLL